MASVIDRDELKGLIDAGEVIVVEALGPVYFEEQHLPGAVNIPHTEVRELAPRLLPDRTAAIVTYCSNAACRNSEAAARELEAMGYTNVRKYEAGKQDWIEAGLPTKSSAVAA